jgi:hypothetical protein
MNGTQLVQISLVLVVENLGVFYLVQEILRGLVIAGIVTVDFQLLHFSLSFGKSFSFLLTFGLFFSLALLEFLHLRSLYGGSFEFFKNILVMQDSVGKFIFESFTAQKLTYTPLYLGGPQDLVDCGTTSWVFLEHARNQATCGICEVARERCILACDNPLCKLMERLGVERRL